jgi:hypothetical protein
MGTAPFDHMQTFCCQSPRKHKKQGHCRKDYAKGGVMERYFHGNGTALLHAPGEDEDAYPDADAGAADADAGGDAAGGPPLPGEAVADGA